MTATRGGDALRQLARHYGLQLEYTDVSGQRQRAPVDSIRAVLKALGADADTPDQAQQTLRRIKAGPEAPAWPETVVAWDGRLPSITAPSDCSSGTLRITFLLDGHGGEVTIDAPLEEHGDGRRQCAVALPEPLPMGVHRLRIESGQQPIHVNVISAPRKCYRERATRRRSLGIFLPLYALRTERDWGVGDLGDLDRLSAWGCSGGCRWIGTLPLLASFLSEPFEPSPYAPVSRLFWNELYIDIGAADELTIAPEARQLLSSSDVERKAKRLRHLELVDYRAVMSLKRQILERLTEAAFQSPSRRRELENFIAARPAVEDYARFRAVAEREQSTWQSWPGRHRDGELREGDFDESSHRYHLYVQWLLHRQLKDLARRNGARGCELYLDLPVGVHGGGYDVWRQREQFASSLSVGAPPDDFFSAGQNWGFPPIHPQHSSRDGHRYFQSVIANHLQIAGMLRIDHVMALHRLFCIPEGASPDHGVYIRYPAEELYAILSLESHRHHARIVGENLGTVPPSVTRTMHRHQVLGMSITQFEFQPDPEQAVPPVSSRNLAALNTHDMPPFAAYWSGYDIEQRQQLGLIDDDQRKKDLRERESMKKFILQYLRSMGAVGRIETPEAVFDALSSLLAEGDAEAVLVNLEDMWLELQPQNVPGVNSHPSWRRRAARTLEQMMQEKPLLERLQHLAALRSSHQYARNSDAIGNRDA